ncbi:MAG: cytochrome P450 [Paracoccaceae bacterium]
MTPPKPVARAEKVSLWRYLKLFKSDILSAQPERLYRAKMAEFRTPFFRSYMINQPDLIQLVLKTRPLAFPKSNRISEGLQPLLGRSVFLTNGTEWQRQRRIIDPAFEGGRLRESFASMLAAGTAAVARLQGQEGELDVEAFASHLAADIIFRTLFSIPITDKIAAQVFEEFQEFQRAQPILNLAAFVPLPKWMPRFHSRKARKSARIIRELICELTTRRSAEIEQGTAPDDLATQIMTQVDPESGERFSTDEMVDQVAIFFLAGHETSASALAWALYLLASDTDVQNRAAGEALQLPEVPQFSDLAKLKFTRDVFRETLRLYPPVPMMVRQTTSAERFRDREIVEGSQIVISPWHLHRNPDYWQDADAFDPDRFQRERGQACLRDAYLPFSTGIRACPGAGFAMLEGTLMLALLLRTYRFDCVEGHVPEPMAHLTVRSRNGIRLTVNPRLA